MIRLLIADDHAIVRSGLRQIIATTSDLQVVAEAGDGAAVLAAVRAGGCDLLVMDMTMPGLSGVDLIRRVRTERPTLPILVLSMHNEGQVVSRALKAGAAGYVAKDCEPDVLLSAMRKVAGGGRFLDPALVDAMVFDSGPADIDTPPLNILSDREYQVLQLVASGQSLNDIGERLNVSAKTVSTHKARLMQKLGIDNNAELVRYAMRHGLLDQ